MKIIFLFLASLLVIDNMCQGQRIIDNQNYAIASPPDSRALLFIKIDSTAKWLWFQHQKVNQPLTSYIFTEGAKKMNLDLYIPKDSLNFYRYSIIENGNKLLVLNATPHGKLKQFVNKSNLPFKSIGSSEFSDYANYVRVDLGEFNIETNKIVIEYYKISEPNKISNTIIYNQPISAVKIIGASLELINNKQQTSHIWTSKPNKVLTATINDSIQITGLTIIIKQIEPIFTYQVFITNKHTGKSIRIPNDWTFPGFGDQANLLINSENLQEAGDYQVTVVPELFAGKLKKTFTSHAKTVSIRIIKLPRKYPLSDFIFLFLISVLIICGIVGTIIFFVKRTTAKKLQRERKESEFVLMKLNLIRSQLNPHFMFNALSGIQSLINKNRLEDANKYLVKFSRLTRNVLNQNDLITIAKEINLLSDYLSMEQLRFNFQFSIIVDPAHNLSEIEIPAMLVQPFVENAVKHAISYLGINGIISIEMKRIENNIIILIIDNGSGFNATKKENGHGSTLMENRISLLNSIYETAFIDSELKSDSNGTVVTLTLKEWL